MKERRLDLLRFQLEELDGAALRPGEEEALLAQRTLYRNAERVASSLQAARAALIGDEETGGALTALSGAVSSLSDAGRFLQELQPVFQRVESLLYELEECAEDLRGYTDSLDFDAEDLERTESRLETIRRLTAKYGGSEEAALEYLEQARQELETIEMSDELADKLRGELETARLEVIAAAEKLTAARRKAAALFTRRVGEELAFLDMPGVTLEVAMESGPLTAVGGDRVEFLIAANPGEPAKPISRIASGGELSRIMLAMKSVLAEVDDIDTLVFDEVDTGISGRAALKVGIKLRQTGKSRQILCVTHLAQIAAQAHHHLLIAKQVRDGRTYTQVAPWTGRGVSWSWPASSAAR